MAKNQFKNQVRLLLEALPFVSKETCFAIKGGTAINLFIRDFPRLNVDIDLTDYQLCLFLKTEQVLSQVWRCKLRDDRQA